MSAAPPVTKAQAAMLIASDPSDLDRESGTGVELRTGADYAVANALKRRDLGDVTGPGGFLSGMYWSNSDGLAVRRELLGIDDEDEDEGEP